MSQSIGCFHGLVSERALQKLKRYRLLLSPHHAKDAFKPDLDPPSLDHQRIEGRAVPRAGEQRKKSFPLCVDFPLVAWERQVGLSSGLPRKLRAMLPPFLEEHRDFSRGWYLFNAGLTMESFIIT